MKWYTEWGLGRSWVQEFLFWWIWDTSHSQYVDVYTNIKALQIPYYFRKTSLSRHNHLIPFPATFPTLENEKWGQKFQASNCSLVFWWPTPNHEPTQGWLVRTKDLPSALIKFMGVSEALCQELGSKYKYLYFLLSYIKVTSINFIRQNTSIFIYNEQCLSNGRNNWA